MKSDTWCLTVQTVDDPTAVPTVVTIRAEAVDTAVAGGLGTWSPCSLLKVPPAGRGGSVLSSPLPAPWLWGACHLTGGAQAEEPHPCPPVSTPPRPTQDGLGLLSSCRQWWPGCSQGDLVCIFLTEPHLSVYSPLFYVLGKMSAISSLPDHSATSLKCC